MSTLKDRLRHLDFILRQKHLSLSGVIMFLIVVGGILLGTLAIRNQQLLGSQATGSCTCIYGIQTDSSGPAYCDPNGSTEITPSSPGCRPNPTCANNVCQTTCTNGEIYCGGCISDCRALTQTCNEWIAEECTGGSGGNSCSASCLDTNPETNPGINPELYECLPTPECEAAGGQLCALRSCGGLGAGNQGGGSGSGGGGGNQGGGGGSPTYSCNSACSLDSQCQTVNANYFCAATYSYSGFSLIDTLDSLFTGAGSGTITAYDTTERSTDRHILQTLIRNGNVYSRDLTLTQHWSNLGSVNTVFPNTGTDTVVAFDTYQTSDGIYHQTLVRGSNVYTRATAANDPWTYAGTLDQVFAIGTGVVQAYDTFIDNRNHFIQSLIRGHTVYVRDASVTSTWKSLGSASGLFSGVGSGVVIAYDVHEAPGTSITQTVLRGTEAFVQTSTPTGNACRLKTNPWSGSCQY